MMRNMMAGLAASMIGFGAMAADAPAATAPAAAASAPAKAMHKKSTHAKKHMKPATPAPAASS